MEKLREMIREREGTIVLPRIENTLNILLLMCDSKTLSEITMLVKVARRCCYWCKAWWQGFI